MDNEKALQSILDNLDSWAGYSSLPPRLEKTYPALAARKLDDEYGLASRLNAIQTVLAGKNLGEMIDLGGNAGYFCLSLLDAGMAEKATVYDTQTGALAAGRQMAELLGVADRIKYIEKSLDLEFVKDLPKVDTLLCLNFIHNAGTVFEVERVRKEGWASFAEQWLRAMKGKSRRAVISVGFDREHPTNWDEPLDSRPQRLARIAEAAGWKIVYYANVRELERHGVEAAAGRYTTLPPGIWDAAVKVAIRIANLPMVRPLKDGLKQLLRRNQALPKVREITGTQKFYHLYILETP
jgi:hypothetical protein